MSMKLTPTQVPHLHYRVWYKHEQKQNKDIISRSASGVRNLEWTERVTAKLIQVAGELTFLSKPTVAMHTLFDPSTETSCAKNVSSFIAGVQMIIIGSECRHCSMCTHIPSKGEVCGSHKLNLLSNLKLRTLLACSKWEVGGSYSIARTLILNTTDRLPVGEIKLLGSST